MGKGRAACCDKNKVKRGPWSTQEDLTLITFIQKHGHQNWRSLPKLAGLMRCGKSCRLRWLNYLRPDVKRGNFSKEEEDAIIQYHQLFGNKWSKMASFLPGRTDNEIKNVWNTHLKKRLSSPSSSTSLISSIHDSCKEAKHCDGHPESQESATWSHLHVNCMDTNPQLHDLDDLDDMTSHFLQTTDMLFPDLSLDSLPLLQQTHLSTEFHIQDGVTLTKTESFEQFTGEIDLWTQLAESSSPTAAGEEDNEWFNFIDNASFFDDFTLVGEVCL